MFYLLWTLGLLLSILPPRAVEGLSNLLAFVLFDVLRFRRRVMLKNLDIAFEERRTPAEKLTIARKSFRGFLLTLFESLRGVRHPWNANVRFENEAFIRDALAQGQGVYVLAIHMGNWEAMGAGVTKFIAPARVVVKDVGTAGVTRFVKRLRKKNQFLVIERKQKYDGTRNIIETLKAKEIVGFVMDQARPGQPRIPLFSMPAKTNTSLAGLWLKAPAPIVPAMGVREGFNRHRIMFFPPISIPENLTYSPETLIEITQGFNRTVEAMIEACPEQYFWLHDRWK